MRNAVTVLALTALLVAGWAAGDAVEPTRKAAIIPQTDQITIPLLLSYQGKVTDTAGRPVPNGLYAVTFSMYAESTGGTAFWTELQNVQARSGLFNVLLGSVAPITYVPWDGNCYLELQVHPDPAMTPRTRIASVAYAYFAAVAETAMTAGRAAPIRPLVPGVSNAEIGANAVTTDKILDHTIKGVDIATPCTLVSSNGNPGAALHIKSRNTGNGIRIDSASNNGIVVSYSNGTGVLVDSSSSSGFACYGAASDGIYIARAGVRGVRVDNAGNYGIAAYGDDGGGFLKADLATGVGLRAESYNGVNTDTAIYADGRGVSTGGWTFDFDDGSGAPCIVAPEQAIIASGAATIRRGNAAIAYPEVFARHIRPDVPVRINLTPRGNPSGMLCVAETDAAGFGVTLKAVPGWDGESDVTFDWIAIGALREPSSLPQPSEKPPPPVRDGREQ
jgi:hypothetical protein